MPAWLPPAIGNYKGKVNAMLDEQSITEYILHTFDGVESMQNFGYTFFFYGTERMLPFATIASTGNEYEHISQLDRPGVFRLNLGVSKTTFQALFGTDKVDVSTYDFTALDMIMPHPDYAAQSFLCVLNPSDATFQTLQPLLAEAYSLAMKRAHRKNADT